MVRHTFRVALKLSLVRSLADFYPWDNQRGFYFLWYVRLSSTSTNKKNQRPIRSHGSVFEQRPLNVLGFDYARMTFLFPFCEKIKERDKNPYCLGKTSLGES